MICSQIKKIFLCLCLMTCSVFCLSGSLPIGGGQYLPFTYLNDRSELPQIYSPVKPFLCPQIKSHLTLNLNGYLAVWHSMCIDTSCPNDGRYYANQELFDINSFRSILCSVAGMPLLVLCYSDQQITRPFLHLYKKQNDGRLILNGLLAGVVPPSGCFSSIDFSGTNILMPAVNFSSIVINNTEYFIPCMKLIKEWRPYCLPCAMGLNGQSLVYFPL
jgi:hypothetical protein